MKYLFLIIIFICSYKLLYSEIVFEGLIKLSDKDLQSNPNRFKKKRLLK